MSLPLSHVLEFTLQLNLQVARSEGTSAKRAAEEATSSYNNIKTEYSMAQSQAKQAAEGAAAEIGSLQASCHCIFLAFLMSLKLDAGQMLGHSCLLVFCHLDHAEHARRPALNTITVCMLRRLRFRLRVTCLLFMHHLLETRR